MDAATNDRASSAFIAAQNGQAECLQLLVAEGADMDAARNDGASPAFIAALKERACGCWSRQGATLEYEQGARDTGVQGTLIGDD